MADNTQSLMQQDKRERVQVETMNAIGEGLSVISKLALSDPLVQAELDKIFSASKALYQSHSELVAVSKNTDIYINQLQAANDELLKQRDAVLDELNDFINGMTAGEFWANDTTQEIYESAVSEHNAAFWESLPYDIASQIGGDWNFMDADLLYDALISHDAEDFAQGRNLDVEVVNEFRTRILDLVRQLQAIEQATLS